MTVDRERAEALGANLGRADQRAETGVSGRRSSFSQRPSSRRGTTDRALTSILEAREDTEAARWRSSRAADPSDPTAVLRARLRGKRIPASGVFSQVGGLEEAVESLREAIVVPLRHRGLVDRAGIQPPSGLLLSGPPGCGKTALVRALADEADARFIPITAAELHSKWLGESERNLRELFEQAAQHERAVIFIDEIDGVFRDRGESDPHSGRLLSQLLGLMDGFRREASCNVVVVAATNRPDRLDPALRRPGRLEREIVLHAPGPRGRHEILQIHTRRSRLARGVDLRDLAVRTDGYSGADLRCLVTEAGYAALRRVPAVRATIKERERTGAWPGTSPDEGVLASEIRAEEIGQEGAPSARSALDPTWDDVSVAWRSMKDAAARAHHDYEALARSLGHAAVLSPAQIERWIYLEASCFAKRVGKLFVALESPTVDFDVESGRLVLTGCFRWARSLVWARGASPPPRERRPMMSVLSPGGRSRRTRRDDRDVVLTRADFEHALRTVKPSLGRQFAREGRDDLPEVAGLADARARLGAALELPLMNPEGARRLGVTPARGVLLWGPPGNGKTLLVQDVARRVGAQLLVVTGGDIKCDVYGQSQRRLEDVFERARELRPAIVFIDELDQIAPPRARLGPNEPTDTRDMVDTLLRRIDGLERVDRVVVIGAVNRPDEIDEAVRREGRLGDARIYVGLPGRAARRDAFRIHTRGRPLAASIALGKLAGRTAGYSFAGIAAICKKASQYALLEDPEARTIEARHFRAAMREIGPSLTPTQVAEYERLVTEFAPEQLIR